VVVGVHLVCMNTDTNPLSGLDPLLSIDELAEYLGVSIKTIYEWRQTGRGPVGIRMGRHVKFCLGPINRPRTDTSGAAAPPPAG